MNKRGLGVAAIILLVLGVSMLLISSSTLGKEGGIFKTLNSPYNVDSIVAKCNTECEAMSKADYCFGLKTLKSDKETLRDITCYYLVKNKLEYGLKKCEKFECEDKNPLLGEDPQKQTSPNEEDTLDLTPGEEIDCRKKIEKLIQKYTASGNTAIPKTLSNIQINPVLFKALLLQESSSAFDINCPYEKIGNDGKSLGLMQITSETACNGKGAYGLPLEIKICEEELKTNIETSIRVASIIFREKYNYFAKPEGKSYSLCDSTKPPKTYYGWQAALRGYNGWAVKYDKTGKCITNDHYVEDVLARCQSFAGKPCLNDKGEVII